MIPAAAGKYACAVAGALCFYSKADDTAIRFIADGSPVPDAKRLFDVAFLDDRAEAAAVARACADILARTPGAIAGADGWHALPAGASLTRMLPTLLSAARNAVWADPSPAPPPPAPIAAAPAEEHVARHRWTPARIARLGYLAGQGLTAKQIAADPILATTPGAVQRAAGRFGLFLSMPRSNVACRLPIATVLVIDRAAATTHQTRDAFVRRWIIKAAREPARYGLTAISI